MEVAKDVKKSESISSSLAGVFFVFDDYCQQNETASSDELILMFYPPVVPLDLRIFLLGGCSAMINFARNFSDDPVSVMTMDSLKMAFKQVGRFVMVLTCENEGNETDSVLLKQLDIIHSSICFFCGDFDTVLCKIQADVNEDVLQQEDGVESDESDPLLDLQRKAFLAEMSSLQEMLMPLISIICDSDPKCNRLKAFPSLMRYTNLPPHSSRCLISGSQLMEKAGALFSSDYLGSCVLLETTLLCTDLDLVIVRCILNAILSLTPPDEMNTPSTLDVFYQGKSAILHLIINGYGSLAILRNKSEDTKDFGLSSHDHAFLSSRLGTLEKLFQTSSREFPSLYCHAGDLRVPFLPHSDIVAHPPLYKCLVYDLLKESAGGNVPLDHSFLRHVSNARKALNTDDSICRILLRDHSSCIYSRRQFGKELFFQPCRSTRYDLFMDHIEKTVTRSMQSNLNSHLTFL